MSNLEHAAELICDPEIREDRRDRLAAEYAAKWAACELHLNPEENADLIRDIGELVALAMREQHARTTAQLECELLALAERLQHERLQQPEGVK
jgi:hypothetical protein